MSPEIEQIVAKKQIGRPREVSPKPFGQALYQLSQSRGFRTQEELTQGLGLKAKASVGRYFRGEEMPSPETFGGILATLKPDEGELETLIAQFSQDLIDKRVRGAQRAQRSRRPSDSLIGQLIEKICDSRKISLKEFSKEIGIGSSRIRDLRRGQGWTLDLLSGLLERAPDVFNLSEEEIENLSSAAAKLIRETVETGQKVKSIGPNNSYRVFRDLSCQTYTGGDLARELHISREAIRQRREKLGIENVILTEADRRRIVKYEGQKSPLTPIMST